MMNPVRISQGLISLLLLLFLFGCNGPDEEQTTAKVAPKESGWSEYVSEHTAHEVSKASKIRIRFVHPVIDDNQVGQSAGSFLTIEPAVVGNVSFSSSREILLIPDAPLRSDSRYQVSVKREGLKGIPATLGDFKFDFRVKKQNFEVTVDSLSVDPANDANYTLSGSVNTADMESSE